MAEEPGSLFARFEARLGECFDLAAPIEVVEGTRGGPGLHQPVSPEQHPVLLVEDPVTGALTWAWPDSRPTRGGPAGGTTFQIAGGADRGVISMVGKRLVRLLVPNIEPALAAAGELMVGRWEQRYRPERLVRFDVGAVDLADDDPAVVAGRDSFGPVADRSPALLLIHGLAARTRSGFSGLRGLGLARLTSRYESGIVGYDHPSLARTPAENAADLADRLVRLHAEDPLPPLDIVGHGRGGLVARALLARLATDPAAASIEIGRVWCIGTPNLGQPFASPDHVRSYLDRLTNLVGWLPLGGVGDVVDGVLTTVAHVALGALSGLDGITSMAPGSPLLADLNSAANIDSSSPKLYAIASNYEPRSGAPFAARARALAADHLLRGPNDLLTTVESTFGSTDVAVVPVDHRRLFGDAHGVNHATYLEHPATVGFIVDPSSSARGGPAITSETWRPTVHDEDGTIVTISVSHCSLEESQYAVMVGTYANESLAGAERFLDRQLKGELSARFQIDRYPAELGTSLFLAGTDDGATTSDPPGAYVIGLGPTISLGRPELARTVRQALVDRCLQLYHVGPERSGIVEVGVSTTLLGVRNNDGLTVTESIAGIVEGVLDANRSLVRYEASHDHGPPPVRITALEIVERYADRADRAVMAVRSLSSIVRLGPGYDELQHLTVNSKKRGGLPAGSAVNDNPQDWQRFVITGLARSVPAASGPQVMELEITALGADARADRVRHELDVTVVDALVKRLGANRGDQLAAGTLFNFLVPDEIRPRFQTATAVQFVVDPATANFPWELLSAPRAGQLRRLAESTSVVRQFTEGDDRRLDPVRAAGRTALVIAAGNVASLPKLPGVYREAEVVNELMRTKGRLHVKVVDDRDAAFDPADLMIDAFGDHKVLHIASHGEYYPDEPARTGARLTEEIVLTAAKVRLLPQVPELVFLNCCNLAQIGSNRLAAGLSRELMAIGVRAVIAAGWPVGDAAAVAFAEVFYGHWLSGTAFGDAVARARLACSAIGGGETWAAYQCYGDPTLIFSEASAVIRDDETSPASRDDLLRRLAALEVRASDLGRPGEDQLDRRRASLLGTLAHLAEWADRNQHATAPVHRQIAMVARRLNDHQQAADRFLRMIEVGNRTRPTESNIRLRDESASAVDLLQAASSLARAALARFLAHGPAAIGPAGTTPTQDLRLAAVLAEVAGRVVGDREAFGIAGGVYRRLALVDNARRGVHLRKAYDAYHRAVQRGIETDSKGDATSRIGRYGYENSRQFAALLGLPDDDTELARGHDVGEGIRRVDERRSLAANFWHHAAVGDRALSGLLRATDAGEARRTADQVLAAYEAAFLTRSTYSDRNSCIDHLRGLALLAHEDVRFALVAGELERICAGLDRWEQVHAPAGAASGAAPDAASEPGSDRAGRTPAFDLHVLHAGKGDCLVLEYEGGAGQTHRIWIDGGIASAHDQGIAPFLAARGPGPLPVDALVVTHIDADHVGGAVRLLADGTIAPKDVWFNGLAQLEAVRGVKQGDEFAKLIPVDARNRLVQGRPLVVTGSGPLKVLQLPGGAVATLLSPDESGLEALLSLWRRHTKRGEDAGAPDSLVDFFDAEETAGAERDEPKIGRDPSVPNRSSIAFLFEHRDRSVLLTGDAHAPVLQASIERLLENRRVPKLRVDLVKLSHHSSRNNVSPAFLELIDTPAFLVCSSGNASHPDPIGLALVRSKFPTAQFHFSDDTQAVRAAARKAGITEPLVPAKGEQLRLTWLR